MFQKYMCICLLFIFLLTVSTMASPSPEAIEGIDLYYQKEWESAKISFREALIKDPLDSLVLSYYYSCFLWTEAMSLGVTEAEEEYVRDPDKVETLVRLAFAYYAMGQVDYTMQMEAKSEFREVLSLEPDLPVAHTGMGMLYNDKRMTPRAKAEFLKALEGTPEDVMALELLGVITMLDDANPKESLTYFSKIIELVPNYPDGHFYMGSAYYKLGDNESALPYLVKTMELDPLGIGKGRFATIFSGDIYMELNMYEEAIASYEKALILNENNIAAQVKLEKAKEALEQKE